MIFFDLEKLQKEADNNPKLMLIMLDNFISGKLPKNKRDSTNFAKKSLVGNSFLLDPIRLLSHKADVNHKVQYLILAAKRDYLWYKLYGTEYLDLSYFPDLNLDKIKGNPLLEVEGNKLLFKI